jgi:hypothetical protein
MSKPISMDTLLQDLVLGRNHGEREWNLLAQQPFDEYRSDRKIALEWFFSSNLSEPVSSSRRTANDSTLVSCNEVASAWRAIGRGLFGKR